MPGFMFQDVVSPRARSNRKWYTLPLSFLVHTSIVAILIVVPLIATDVLPRPRAMLQFVEPFVPAFPQPPAVRRTPVSQATQGMTGAPVVAPHVVGVETGLIFEPGDVETTGIDGIVGLGAAEVALEAPPAQPIAPPEPVAVADLLRPPVRTRYVMPVYPDIARAARVQGVVVIEAIIGIDGTIEQTRVLRSNPLLDQAALAAVKGWEYTPTLLNGRPTPVIMTVTVNFRLQ